MSPAPKGGLAGRAYTRDGGGEKKRLYAVGATEAEVRSSLELQAKRSVYVGGEMTPETPLAHALQKWLEDRDGEVRLQSMRIYRDTVRWLTPMAGALLIGDMTPQQCKSLLTDIKNRRSAGAVDHARTALNGALGVAVEDGVIDHNPLLSLRKRKGQKRIPTALTVEQVRVLREVVRAREERVRPRAGASASVLRWTIELQLGSSCRVSEALALRNVDHDRENGCIAVTGTMVDDEDWQYVRQEELKSREQARLIQLPRFALAALNEARASQAEGNRGPMAPAIQGRAHGKFIAPRNVRRSLRDLRTDPELGEALAVTGLTQEVLTPHVLRRTAATLVAKSTGNLRASRELLGHADENTTRRSYAGEAYQVVGSAALLDDILGF